MRFERKANIRIYEKENGRKKRQTMNCQIKAENSHYQLTSER